MMKCPLCKSSVLDHAFRPFCSARCKDIDLGRWLFGRYVLTSVSLDHEDGESDVSSFEEGGGLIKP